MEKREDPRCISWPWGSHSGRVFMGSSALMSEHGKKLINANKKAQIHLFPSLLFDDSSNGCV